MGMAIAAKMGVQVGARLNLDRWAIVNILVAIVAATLGVALKGAARLQAIAAGSLMAATWIVGILVGGA
jgi:hypothetical protein